MIRLSDKGKFRLRKLFSFQSLLYFLLVFFCSCASYFSFYWSTSATQDRVAAKFAEAADESDTKSLNVLLTSTESSGRTDYIQMFQTAFELNRSNRNAANFDSYAGFYPGNNLFGQNFSYRCPDIYPDVSEMAVFSSPVNSMADSDAGESLHEIWNVKFLFSSSVLSSVTDIRSTNFCYIPVSSADYMLSKRGIESPSNADYASLLGQTVEVYFLNKNTKTEQTMNWCIANIYEEDKQYDFYVSRFGYPLFCYLGLPSFDYPSISIDLGHSQFMCKDYLSSILEGDVLPASSFFVSIAPGIDGKTSITSKNVNSELSGFDGGHSNYLCIGIYLFALLIFSVAAWFLVSTNYYFFLGLGAVSFAAYSVSFICFLAFSLAAESSIPFYSSIFAVVAFAWLFAISCFALSCKRARTLPLRRLDNDKLAI